MKFQTTASFFTMSRAGPEVALLRLFAYFAPDPIPLFVLESEKAQNVLQQASQVTSHAALPCHARSRGTHALTFRQYSSYSVPKIFRSVGSSYSRTNSATPRTTARAAEISAQFAWPKTTHSPAHPPKNPKYMGFRTYR